MKKKKQLTAIVAVTMCAAQLVAFTACDDETIPAPPSHTHSYKWTEAIAPTCSTEGLETGACETCDDGLTYRSVAKVTDAHVYGDWEIAEPTETEKGKATKKCVYDATHKVEVELPVTTSTDGYTSATVTTPPTKTTAGVKTFKLANDLGEITFTKPVAALGVKTVDEAIEVGLENKNTLRGGSVIMGSTQNSKDILNIGVKSNTKYGSSERHSSYEYGDAYTYINDGENRVEYWLSTDDEDNITAFYKDDGGELSLYKGQNAENLIKGVNMFLYIPCDYPQNITTSFFGTEDFIEGLYLIGQHSVSNQLVSEVKEVEGETVYSFSFLTGMNYIQNVINNETTKEITGLHRSYTLSKISVSFTLTQDYAIDRVLATGTVYNYSYDLRKASVEPEVFDSLMDTETDAKDKANIEPSAANPIKLGTDEKWYVDENGAEAAFSRHSEVVIDQLATSDRPESPYKPEELMVGDFKVTNAAGEELVNNAVIEMDVDSPDASSTPKPFVFNFTEVSPATANMNIDGVKAYYIDNTGAEVELSRWTYGNEISAPVLNSKTMSLRATVVGEYTLLLKTANVTKTYTVKVKPIAPKEISASVYNYVESTNSNVWSDKATAATVFVGQELALKSSVTHAAYDARYTVSLAEADREKATLTATTIGDESAYAFKATQAGQYVITFTSTAAPSVKSTVTVHVQDTPNVAEIVKGNYENRKDGITVSFTPASEGATSGELSLTVTPAEGTASSEVLDYAYVDGAITLTHKSGAELGYGLELNPLYHLVLTKAGAGTTVNRYVLYAVIEDAVDPAELLKDTTWTVSGNSMIGSYTHKVVFNADGTSGFAESENNGTVYKVEFTYICLLNGDATKGNFEFTFVKGYLNGTESSNVLSFNCETASSEDASFVTLADKQITGLTLTFHNFFGGKQTLVQGGGSDTPDPAPDNTLEVGNNNIVVSSDNYAGDEYKFTATEAGTYRLSVEEGSTAVIVTPDAPYDGIIDTNDNRYSHQVTLAENEEFVIICFYSCTLKIEKVGGGSEIPDPNALELGVEKEVTVPDNINGIELSIEIPTAGNYTVSIAFVAGNMNAEYEIWVNNDPYEDSSPDATLNKSNSSATIAFPAGKVTIIVNQAGGGQLSVLTPITVSENGGGSETPDLPIYNGDGESNGVITITKDGTFKLSGNYYSSDTSDYNTHAYEWYFDFVVAKDENASGGYNITLTLVETGSETLDNFKANYVLETAYVTLDANGNITAFYLELAMSGYETFVGGGSNVNTNPTEIVLDEPTDITVPSADETAEFELYLDKANGTYSVTIDPYIAGAQTEYTVYFGMGPMAESVTLSSSNGFTAEITLTEDFYTVYVEQSGSLSVEVQITISEKAE